MSKKEIKYQLDPTNKYLNDLKLAKKQGKNLDKLDEIVDILAAGKQLEPKYKDHKLNGKYQGYRECHIEADWLLIYKKFDSILVLILLRTSSHSELF